MNAYSFVAHTADGAELPLSDFAGKTLLLVNVASKCGLTPQYEGLEKLHRDFADQGLQILGFPCNQFGGQEPGTAEEIAEFCSTKYDVTFPVLAKIDVNGPTADPLYQYLRAADPGDFTATSSPGIYEHIAKSFPERIGTDEIKWNFTKFLVGPDGDVIKRYEPTVTPEAIAAELPALLA